VGERGNLHATQAPERKKERGVSCHQSLTHYLSLSPLSLSLRERERERERELPFLLNSISSGLILFHTFSDTAAVVAGDVVATLIGKKEVVPVAAAGGSLGRHCRPRPPINWPCGEEERVAVAESPKLLPLHWHADEIEGWRRTPPSSSFGQRGRLLWRPKSTRAARQCWPTFLSRIHSFSSHRGTMNNATLVQRERGRERRGWPILRGEKDGRGRENRDDILCQNRNGLDIKLDSLSLSKYLTRI